MLLETENLIIRPVKQEDKNDIFEYRSDRKTNKYQGWIPESPDDVEAFIGKIATKINEPDSWFQMAMIEKNTHRLVGDLGIHFVGTGNKQVEIGCTLNKRFQGNGYATESISKVIDYLFFVLKKHRIITSIDPRNTRSVRLVERIGFRKEAHFKKRLYINGEWVDDLVYALTEKDWEKRK